MDNQQSIAKKEKNLTPQEVAKLAPLHRIKHELIQRKDELGGYLQAFNIDFNIFVNLFIESASNNKELLDFSKYDLGSWIMAAKNATRTGFLPDSMSQYAYIIPRRKNMGTYQLPKWENHVYYQLGYLAIKKMMQDHPDVSHVVCEIVYKNDLFKTVKLPKPSLIHEPTIGNKGERIGAYAAIFYKNRMDNPEYVYMDKDMIFSIMSQSEGIKKAIKLAQESKKEFTVPEHSPWHPSKDPNGWMWLKCAIRALAKKEDLSDERLQRALKIDVAVDADYDDVTTSTGDNVLVRNEAAKQERTIEIRESVQSETSQNTSNKIMGVAASVDEDVDDIPDDIVRQAEEEFAKSDAQAALDFEKEQQEARAAKSNAKGK